MQHFHSFPFQPSCCRFAGVLEIPFMLHDLSDTKEVIIASRPASWLGLSGTTCPDHHPSTPDRYYVPTCLVSTKYGRVHDGPTSPSWSWLSEEQVPQVLRLSHLQPHKPQLCCPFLLTEKGSLLNQPLHTYLSFFIILTITLALNVNWSLQCGDALGDPCSFSDYNTAWHLDAGTSSHGML